MFGAEERHWWYRGMERIMCALLDRWYAPGAGLRILDAGCGTGGAMTSYLARYGRVTGVDSASAALAFCLARGAERPVRASVMQLPFRSGSFDLVTSFDVLYEQGVPDDLAALREFARVLAGRGRVLVRLPAYDWLRGRHDRAVHTRRRYTRRRIAVLLAQAGFEIEHLSYANTFLFPVALAKRLSDRIRPCAGPSDLALPVGPFNGLLAAILSAEAPLVARRGLPFGLTVVAAGRKP